MLIQSQLTRIDFVPSTGILLRSQTNSSNRRPVFLFFAYGLMSVLVLCGCNSGNVQVSSGDSNLAGTLRIEGSSTVAPISIKAKEMFNAIHPNVNISVSGKGTGNGFAALSKKEADIADASRPIVAKELGNCQAAGVEFYEIPIAYDGLTIVVNRANEFVRELTVEQLIKIFREDFAAKTWNEIDPSWPSERITVYAAGIASGTHDYFVEVIGHGTNKGLRSDERTTLSEDDKLLVRGVKDDKYSIGFFGYSYYVPEQEVLRAVKIVNENGVAVEPTTETIISGEYSPFSRPLFIYISADSFKRVEVNEFVNFYLENAPEIVTKAAYVPLPDEIYERCFERIEAEQNQGIGTHYLDSNDQKRTGSILEVYDFKNLRR